MTVGRTGLRAGLGMSPYRAGTKPLRSDVAAILSGDANTSWYDFSDLTNNKPNSDGSGTLTVGSTIGYVHDQSGNGRHLLQSNVNARPILVLEGGIYKASFDGIDDMLVSGSANLNQGSTVALIWAGEYAGAIAASYAGAWQTSTRYFRVMGASGGTRVNPSIRGSAGTIHSTAFLNGSFPPNMYGVLSAQAKPATLTARTASGAAASVAVSTDTSNPTSRIQLSGSVNQPALTPNKSAGLVLYAGELTDDQFNIIRAYFS